MLNKIEDRRYLFLGKRGGEDRDCCIYVDATSLEFECGHYFSGIHFTGACFCGFEKEIFEDMKNGTFKTILKEEDLKELMSIEEKISNLGYSIVVDDERYLKGLELQKRYKEFLKKLKTQDAEDLFQEIIKEEKEYCKDEYYLDDEEIEKIFDAYNLDYQDRAIIGCIYRDVEEFGQEMFDICNEVTDNVKSYIDYESYANDILDEDSNYMKLDDNRVVSFSY
jgi:hypothetical protein